MFEYGLNKYASHLLTARISKCQNIFVMPQESSGDASFAAYLTRHLCDKTRRMEAKIKAWQRKGQPEHTRLVRLVAGLVSTPVESLPMRIVRADGDLSEISEISWEVESIPDPWTAALEDSYPFGVEVMWWRRGKHPRQGHAQFFRIPVVFQHFR